MSRRNIRKSERRQQDILHRRARLADRRQPPHQRVRWRDLVVAVGADQEQVMHIRLRQHMLEQIERCRIEPLQIVEEQRQRMLRPGKHAEKAPEHELEAALRVLRRQLRDRRLVAEDELQFGDNVDHEPPVRAQRLHQARRAHGSARPRSG